MSKLTQERVRELFDYDPETGSLSWRISPTNNVNIGDEVGCISDWCRVANIGYRIYKVHRIIWLYVYGYFPEHEIDHINRNPYDNRLCNLRESSHSCNCRNQKNRIDNTSGVKGVSWHKQAKRWRVRIFFNKKEYLCGMYKHFHNAVCARLAAEQCLRWSACDSNSTAYQWVKTNIINAREE